MNLLYENKEDIKHFFKNEEDRFEERLLEQAVNVRDKLKEIDAIGNINLVNNAKKLVNYVIEENQEEIKAFAKQEGIIWAKNAMTLALKLEWVQAIRRTFWEFIEEYTEKKRFLQLQMTSLFSKKIDDMVDDFMNGFFLSYAVYKDELLEKQRKLVDNLSVPIIPITQTISVLPLIGTLDDNRARIIEEKALMEIAKSKVHTLIIDLSGIAETSPESVSYFAKLMEAIKMMGCEPILTGLRPEMVQQMLEMDIHLLKNATVQ
ncbi:anti-anti-sigma factor [Virgibacillus sp. 179-BFC.A HS]|uniref:Anti-anti-sigma factor n=1 Tax=Tigheibacillus jepli TaxID=3035914 RepID=A0ABU5CHP2_9BACI|nr:STAS domain-containing protein [Virgibacillus sp. 179-BFC.A HS]MDY0405849.1 anti-anti-sigma factor [Virgibacillus sp. 179-BFC.A HS]